MGDNEQYSKEVLIWHLSLSLFFLVTLLSHLITNTHDNTSLFTSSDITKLSGQLLFLLWRILLSFTNLRQMYKHISTWLQLFRDQLERTKHSRYTKACDVALARSRRPLTWHSWWRRWHRVRFSSDYFGFLLSVSSHRCVTLNHSPVNDAVWLQQLTESSSKH